MISVGDLPRETSVRMNSNNLNLAIKLEERVSQLKNELKSKLVFTNDGIYSNYLLMLFRYEYADQTILREVIRKGT